MLLSGAVKSEGLEPETLTILVTKIDFQESSCVTKGVSLRGEAGGHHSIKRQDEAALGIFLGWGTVAPIAPRLQVREAVVRVMQHRSLV